MVVRNKGEAGLVDVDGVGFFFFLSWEKFEYVSMFLK